MSAASRGRLSDSSRAAGDEAAVAAVVAVGRASSATLGVEADRRSCAGSATAPTSVGKTGKTGKGDDAATVGDAGV
ncbi:MAG TPA: hypothetical protein VGH63_14900, partial [Polyangia bacterium]